MFPTRFYALLLLLLACLPVSAQDFPYQLDWKKEAVILGTGGLISGVAHAIEKDLPGLTAEEIATLNPATVSAFDRGATRQMNGNYRKLSDKLLNASVVTPGLLLLGKPARSKPLVLGVMMAETFLVTEGLTKMGKVIVRRNRPFTYNPDFSLGEQTNNDARQSFPSGHTSITAGFSFFAAKVFHDLHPDSKARPFVWAGAALLPAATGYARYRAGKHFPTDILVGYALGATVGILIPELHKTPGERGLSVDVTGNGLGLVYKW